MISLVENYKYCMSHLSDPRSKDWLLLSSPWLTIVLVVLYLVAVHAGQRFMARRAPFDLREVMVVYNLGLVLLSVYMLYELIISSWLVPGFNMHCALVDTSDDAVSYRLANVVWWYYFSKLIEFADTIFFVLRKKDKQITFLHLYHHASMPLLWWMGARFAPGGEVDDAQLTEHGLMYFAYFSSTLNSFVHIVMYSYYMLSARGPHMQPYLWWKKYLTSLQLLQFFLVLAKVSHNVFSGCAYPPLFQKMLLFYTLSLIAFFSNFYYQTYLMLRPRLGIKTKGKSANENAGSVAANGVSASAPRNRVKSRKDQ